MRRHSDGGRPGVGSLLSESLQDVALAVTALTFEQRDIVGVISIQDLTDFTPGLSYATTLDRMSLRGVGRLTNNHGWARRRVFPRHR